MCVKVDLRRISLILRSLSYKVFGNRRRHMLKKPRPTDGEMAILRVLWDQGPATVRQIHEKLGRDTAYTTVLKLLQIMTEKGLVSRDESARTHIYAAAQPAAQTQKLIIKDLLDRVFAGSS